MTARAPRAFTWAAAAVLSSCSGAREAERLAEARVLLEVERLEHRDLPEEAPLLQAAFLSESPRVRRRAALAFGRRSLTAPPPELASLARSDPDPMVRAECVLALGALGFESAIPLLGEVAAAEAAVEARAACARALGSFSFRGRGAGGAVGLLALARDPEPEVRAEALTALGRTLDLHPAAQDGAPGEGDLSSLRASAERGESEGVRWRFSWLMAAQPAAAAAFEMPLERGVPGSGFLVEAVGDPNYLVSTFALEALREGEETAGVEEILVLLRRPGRFWVEREAAWHTVGALLGRPLEAARREAIERLVLETVAAPEFERTEPIVRQRILSALVRLGGEEARERLARELRRGSAGDEAAALESLAALADEGRAAAGLEWFRAHAPSGSQSWRARAARARAEMRAGPAALQRALVSPEAGIRALALLTALDSRGPRGHDHAGRLRAALEDPVPGVRRAALWGLIEEGHPPDQATLARLLGDRGREDDWPLRVLAVVWARAGAAAEALPALGLARDDPVAPVARLAVKAAVELGAGAASEPSLFRAPEPPRYPLLSPSASGRQRDPRVEVRLRGRGSFRLELRAGVAPHHVASFMALVRSGYYRGRHLDEMPAALGARASAGPSPEHPVAGAALSRETSGDPLLRGTVFSLPAHWPEERLFALSTAHRLALARIGRWGPSAAGSFVVAKRPLPELEGLATPWGRVTDGMDRVDRLEPGDEIEEVTVLSPLGPGTAPSHKVGPVDRESRE
jgi:cyclophilin family peptidyl-prolyl cis-trans isomerase/HEAT repeat protein